jgi:3-hydroxyacyl-CoA dehydrogenase
VNRCLGPYLAEAAQCAESGADPRAVDAALERFGMALGPCAVIGAVGLWTARRAAAVLRAAHGARHAPTQLLDFLEPAHVLARDGRTPDWRHWRAAAARGAAARRATRRPTVPAAEIVERCVLALVNEVAFALQEGVVADAAAVDLALVLGAGFAPWSGGPCRWADAQGTRAIVDRLRHLQGLHGDRFAPAPWLTARAADGRGFHD